MIILEQYKKKYKVMANSSATTEGGQSLSRAFSETLKPDDHINSKSLHRGGVTHSEESVSTYACMSARLARLIILTGERQYATAHSFTLMNMDGIMWHHLDLNLILS